MIGQVASVILNLLLSMVANCRYASRIDRLGRRAFQLDDGPDRAGRCQVANHEIGYPSAALWLGKYGPWKYPCPVGSDDPD